jgi:type 1 glutamine amidotransferase
MEEERDILVFVDEDGVEIEMEVLDYFYHEDQEYALLTSYDEDCHCHGGMCDAFRNCVQWQFMTGGNWVSHPGGDGVEYMINIKKGSSPIVEGIEDFPVKSEQYYLHVDPAVEVLATTRFPIVDGPHATNGQVDVPQIWTKRWGAGRVFYNALGHHADIFEIEPALEIMRRGFLWAAEGKEIAKKEGAKVYENLRKMF